MSACIWVSYPETTLNKGLSSKQRLWIQSSRRNVQHSEEASWHFHSSWGSCHFQDVALPPLNPALSDNTYFTRFHCCTLDNQAGVQREGINYPWLTPQWVLALREGTKREGMIGTDVKPIEYEVPELKPYLGSVNWSEGWQSSPDLAAQSRVSTALDSCCHLKTDTPLAPVKALLVSVWDILQLWTLNPWLENWCRQWWDYRAVLSLNTSLLSVFSHFLNGPMWHLLPVHCLFYLQCWSFLFPVCHLYLDISSLHWKLCLPQCNFKSV